MTGQIFGMILTPPAERTVVVPPGYEQFRLWLGDWSETFLSSIEVWTVADYVSHWRESAAACGAGTPTLFCAEMQKRGLLDIWIALPEGDEVLFYNRLTPRREFAIEEHRLRPNASSVEDWFGVPSSDASCWRVPRAIVATAGNPWP